MLAGLLATPMALMASPPEATSLLSLIDQMPARGLGCGPRQIREVIRSAETLLAKGPSPSFPSDLERVDGCWKLRFTSAGNAVPDFVPEALLPPEPPQQLRDLLTGVLGDKRPQPLQISQRISVADRRLVNCVTFSPWPGGSVGSALASAPGPLGQVLTTLSDGAVTLELDHQFSVSSEGGAGTSRIDLQLERISRSLEAPPSPPGSVADLIPRNTDYPIPSLLGTHPR